MRLLFWNRPTNTDARVDALIDEVAPDVMSLGDRVLFDTLAWKVAEHGPSEETAATARELAGRYPSLVGEVVGLVADGWVPDGVTDWRKGDRRRSMTRGQQEVLARLDRSWGRSERTGQPVIPSGQVNGQTGHRSSERSNRSSGQVNVTGHDSAGGPVTPVTAAGPVINAGQGDRDRSEETGQPVNGPAVRLLTDVLRTALSGEVKVSIGTVLDRLTALDPDRYRGLTVTELSDRLRELEVMVGHRFFGTRTPSGERSVAATNGTNDGRPQPPN